MINPTEKDIGRRVVYTPIRGPKEYGVITAFNLWTVHVRYEGDNHSKATSREDLSWDSRSGK